MSDDSSLGNLVTRDLLTQRWTHQRGVLGADALKKLNDYFDQKRDSFQSIPYYRSGEVVLSDDTIRGDLTHRPDFNSLPEDIFPTDILEELRISLNRDLGTNFNAFTLECSYYPVTNFFQFHRDQFAFEGPVFTYLLYIHSEWEEKNGGKLIIFDELETQKELARIIPEPGSIVLFASRELPHKVQVSSRERRLLKGFFYTR